MATVTVRKLDDEVRRLLRIRAATHNQSMEAEIRDILTAAVATPPATPRRGRTRSGRATPASRHSLSDQGLDALTTREKTVAALVSRGLTNRQIAGRLYLSERTVETHVGAILGKLGLRSRSGVAARYLPPATDK